MSRSDGMLSPATISAALGQFAPTDEQAAVIAAPMRPTLVVAGAGSGKTETMAGRVVWLVANGLVARDEVLGLTFTRKAAGELAERIQHRLARLGQFERAGLIPHLPRLHREGALAVFARLHEREASPGAWAAEIASLAERVGARPAAFESDDLLHRPTVSTYNSFADAIMRENAVRIGADPEAIVLTDAAAWLLMRTVVYASDDPRLEELDRSPSTIIDAALNLARDAVDNLADLDEVAQAAQRFQHVLEVPSENARTMVYADVRKAAAAVQPLGVLTALAAQYADEKRRRGVLDFSDQVAGALTAVTAHPDVADELRSRYRVVLLDEYQDTSVVQTRLLAGLFAGTGVMAVGDPHQAIYGWRGASAGNLGGFHDAFAPGDGRKTTFSLLTSWRNSREVLAAADAVLEPLAASAAVPVGALRARPGAPRGQLTVVMDHDLDDEAEHVAAWFERTRDERRSQGRTTTGAVLFRSKRHMQRFADALARHGVPHRILGLGGLLSMPEVVDVVSALRVIADPEAGSALIRLLAGPRWGIGVRDLRALAELASRIARHDVALQPLAPDVLERTRHSSGDEGGSLVDAVDFIARHPDDHGWLRALTPAARERLREAGATFARLRSAAGAPVAELVRMVEAELRLDVELAANEARGPARTATAQLRRFVDEVESFLSTDTTASLPGLLAWLDREQRDDDLTVHREPPEPDVVQLLTIHGAKGLEWDAVAVVRMVEGELPGSPRSKNGWLSFGVLPYSFRGDRAWLPEFAWRSAATQQELRSALESFREANAARHEEEERRLAYVAVTRAREHLLLTGSSWSGLTRPREAGVFLKEVAAARGLSEPVDPDPGENPFAGTRAMLHWPMDPLAGRRERVQAAAGRVRAAMAAPLAPPTEDLALLLAERDQQRRPRSRHAPVRIPASRYKDFVGDYDGTVDAIERPMPERPYRQTQIGTLFHQWVEGRADRSARVGPGEDLWDQERLFDEDEDDGGAQQRHTLRHLQEVFERSEWASLQPIEVETEIDFRFDDLDGRPHVAICKIDAVYRRGDRIEIVDWKTGAAPRDATQREARMLQLELYRRAYHQRHGVPLADIDVVLFYVGDDLIIRG